MDINEMSSWGLSKAIYDVIENGYVFDEETGEVYFTSDDLEALEDALDDKLNGMAGYIKLTESKIEALKQRKKDVEENIKYYTNRNDRLKDFLKMFMEGHDIEKKELKDYRLGFRKSKSVDITNEEEVKEYINKNPKYKESCIKEETKVSIIKTGIKDLINEGNEVPGATIVENKNVTIK